MPDDARVRRVTTLFLPFILTLAACGGGGRTEETGAVPSAPSTAAEATSTTNAGEEVAARVYFVRQEKVATAGRFISAPNASTVLLEQLLAGPSRFETDIGMSTEIPGGTKVRDATIDDRKAIVDLSGEFASGGGSLSMQLRVAQVVFTLTLFDTIDAVTILIDGKEVDGIGGEGIPAVDLTRDDFQNVTPMILVESPVPGEEISSPSEVSGISNTFEANVRYAITDPDGIILREGFTTATAGNGEWGTFGFTAEYETSRSGLGAVIVWQDDAESGAQRDVYEVPVQIG
jgi:Sporulation and spore germination/Immunoglobulin-like domain of bacterial spore germination